MHTILSTIFISLFSLLFITQKKIMIVDNEVIQIDSVGTINNLSFKYENGFDPEKFKRFELNEKIVFLNMTTYTIYH